MHNFLVRDRELAEEVSDHFGFDLDGYKLLTRVQMQRQSQHLRNDDHVPGVGLDRCRLSPTVAVLTPRLANMLQQCPLVVRQALEQRSTLARRKKFDKFIHRHLLHLLQVVTAIGELSRHRTSSRLLAGVSVRPAPATTPIIALQLSFTWIVLPEGIRSSVPIGVCETTVANEPDDRAIVPPSPWRSSILQIIVPSGIFPRVLMLPISAGTSDPKRSFCPTAIPSGAGT